jgi:heme-degrading monooxygenase HmoA
MSMLEQECIMIVTVFRSRLMPGLKDEYVALVDRMQQIAKTIPGYISHKGFWSDDGERVTIVEFEHEEGQRAWRMHPEHIEAQRQGRAKYYSEYDIKVCEVKRHNAFQRDGKP